MFVGHLDDVLEMRPVTSFSAGSTRALSSPVLPGVAAATTACEVPLGSGRRRSEDSDAALHAVEATARMPATASKRAHGDLT